MFLRSSLLHLQTLRACFRTFADTHMIFVIFLCQPFRKKALFWCWKLNAKKCVNLWQQKCGPSKPLPWTNFLAYRTLLRRRKNLHLNYRVLIFESCWSSPSKAVDILWYSSALQQSRDTDTGEAWKCDWLTFWPGQVAEMHLIKSTAKPLVFLVTNISCGCWFFLQKEHDIGSQ